MPTKTRNELKVCFKKNAIPTESDFADLIDSQLNIANDGIETDATIGTLRIKKNDKPGTRFFVEGQVCVEGKLRVKPLTENPVHPAHSIWLEPGSSPNAGFLRFGDESGWQLHIGSFQSGNPAKENSGTSGAFLTLDTRGRLGIGTIAPEGALDIVRDGADLGGFKSPALNVHRGLLNSAKGSELTMANFSYTAQPAPNSNNCYLSIRARRTNDNPSRDWFTTALGMVMDVDGHKGAGPGLWFSGTNQVTVVAESQARMYLTLADGANGIGDGALLSVSPRFGAAVSGGSWGSGLFASNLATYREPSNPSNPQAERHGAYYTIFDHEKGYGYSGVEASWGILRFFTSDGNTKADERVEPKTRMVIQRSGEVVIGNNAPTDKLTVNGSVDIKGCLTFGSIAQGLWHEANLNNGWINENERLVKYFKDSCGMVHLTGVIKANADHAKALAFNIVHADCMPEQLQDFYVSPSGILGPSLAPNPGAIWRTKVTIDSEGNVTIVVEITEFKPPTDVIRGQDRRDNAVISGIRPLLPPYNLSISLCGISFRAKG